MENRNYAVVLTTKLNYARCYAQQVRRIQTHNAMLTRYPFVEDENYIKTSKKTGIVQARKKEYSYSRYSSFFANLLWLLRRVAPYL